MPEETNTGAAPTAASGPEAPARRASPVRLQDDLLQVNVDQWGHRGEYTRGMILHRSDIDTAHYDVESALMRGVVRRLTEAEARPESWPLTTALDENGEVDQDHARAMAFHAGIVPDGARTVTTEQGPPEPAEFSKPTIAFTGDNQPAARPVIIGSALEAETEGARAGRIVATPAGSVFESSAERAERESSGTAGRPSASELTARARAATTAAELDEIDGQADARMTTVHEAVAQRRTELAQEG